MAWETLQPTSIDELHQNLVRLHENRAHVSSIRVITAIAMIQVDLDWVANAAGHRDFQIPLRRNMVTEAQEIVAIMLGETQRGVAPGRAAAERLWACLDVTRR